MSAGGARGLDLLVVGPLPIRSDGNETFHFGASVFYEALLPRLAARGHRVRAVAEVPPSRSGLRRGAISWTVPGIEIAEQPLTYLAGSAGSAPRRLAHVRREAAALLDAILARERPDVVVIGRETLARVLLGPCRRYGVPTLLIAHGSPTAGLLDGVFPATLARELVARFREVDALVAVAPYLAEILGRLGLTGVRVIPNVADPAVFRPEPKDPSLLRLLGLTPDQIVIGHVSNLAPSKRPMDVVRSAVQVLASDPAIAYLIVGDGPCRAEMAALAVREGIAASVHFVGEVAHREVPRYLSLCDVVLLPSARHGVPLLVYREAQACGRVVLASDIPAAREAIEDGETGALFPMGDLAELIAKALALAHDHSWRARIGAQARAAAETRTPEGWVDAYETELRSVARRAARRRPA
ncbi:MAG: glycosyltransferase family 4 protein [Deltaproteobacteria bacterium]|nr:glycosyltransferase family 4 protein [Deltaproteobacteria bacterium]